MMEGEEKEGSGGSSVALASEAHLKAVRKRRKEEKQRKKLLAKEKRAGNQKKTLNPAEAARAAADALVQSTNDFSIKSKLSMARKRYVRDDRFGKYFVETRANRAPLINRAYYARAAAVRHAVDLFLEEHRHERVQICSLGAGFDTTFFRLAESGRLKACDLFVEIDFPDLMAKKEAVINTHPDMLQWVHVDDPCEVDTATKEEDSKRRRLVTISADLSDLALIEKEFVRNGVSPSCATLLVSECVMTYMSPESSSALIEWAGTFFTASGGPGAAFAVYEQTEPNDPFGKIMVRHFKKFGSPLRCIDAFPSYEAYEERYKALGWTPRLVDLNRVFLSLISEEERERVLKLEPFDEHEELHAKCAHYFLLVAVVRGCALERAGLLDVMVGPRDVGEPSVGVPLSRDALMEALDCARDASHAGHWECSAQDERWNVQLRRWGHDGCLVDDGESVLVFGGAGGLHHARLNDVLAVNTRTLKVEEIAAGGKVPSPRMFHTCTAYEGGVLLFGGRFGPMLPYNELFLFITSTSVWERLQTSGEPPSPRWRHSATLSSNGRFLVVLGGRNSEGPVRDFGYVLDITERRWRPLSSPQVTARYSHSASLVGDKIVMIGGLSCSGAPIGDVWQLQERSWTWEKLSDIALPEGRGGKYSHRVLSLRNEMLLCVGGSRTARRGIAAEDFAAFDVKARQWRFLDKALPELPSLPVMLFNHCCFRTPQGLLIVGGGGNCVSFGTHFNPFLVSLQLS